MIFNLHKYAGIYLFPKGAIFGYTHAETFQSHCEFVEKQKAETYGDASGVNHMKVLKGNIPYGSWTWIYDIESGR